MKHKTSRRAKPAPLFTCAVLFNGTFVTVPAATAEQATERGNALRAALSSHANLVAALKGLMDHAAMQPKVYDSDGKGQAAFMLAAATAAEVLAAQSALKAAQPHASQVQPDNHELTALITQLRAETSNVRLKEWATEMVKRLAQPHA